MQNLPKVHLLVLATLTLSAAPVVLAEEPCTSSPTTLCLAEGRFEVEVDWRDFEANDGSGRVLPFASADSGLFWFFDAENWELLVKVLDGCAVNDHFWVFSAATTNVEYTLHVRDTATGVNRSYSNPLGTSAPAITDATAFETCSPAPSPAAAPVAVAPPPRDIPHRVLAASSCAAGDASACLAHERFKVDVEWRDFQGNAGQGRLAPFGTDTSALYWFFAPDNWEMLVKVLDGCTVNDHFWVFSAATTNVEYTLRVTDTFTGEVRTYENPLGRSAPAITESTAFATCAVTEPPRVELVSDPTVLLRHAGDQVRLEARVVDSNGKELPDARVDWSSSDPALAEVLPEGPLAARVTALAEPPTSTTVRATYRSLGVDTLALIASIQPESVLLPTDSIHSTGPGSVVVEPGSFAEALRPGQILLNLGNPPLLEQVVSVTPSADGVAAETTPAAFTDAFRDLELHVTTGTRHAAGAARTLLDRLDCEQETNAGPKLSVTGFSGSLEVDLWFDNRFRIVDGSVRELRLAVAGDMGLSWNEMSATFEAAADRTYRCVIAGPEFKRTGGPLLFSGTLIVSPKVEIEATGSLASVGFTLTLNEGSVHGALMAGIEYTSAAGWRTLSDHSWSSNVAPLDFDARLGAVELEGWLFAGADVALGVNFGHPPLGVSLLQTEFVQLRGGASFDASLALPIEPYEAAYTGPEWFVGMRARGGLQPNLENGALKKLLDRFGVVAEPRLNLTLFDLKEPLARSPRFTLTADQTHLNPAVPDSTVLSASGPSGEGTIEFIARHVETGSLTSIAEVDLVGGSAVATWTPSESEVGEHEILAHIRSDQVSELLPYAAVNTVQIEVTDDEVVPPTITNVSPNPVPASTDPQLLTIEGTGFQTGAIAILRKEGLITDPSPALVSLAPERMVIQATFGVDAASWTVEVENPDHSLSAPAAFTIVPPTGTPPTINSIEPNPVDGSNWPRRIHIYGEGLVHGSTATFRKTGVELTVPSETAGSPSKPILQAVVVLGADGGSWTVETTSPNGVTSNAYPFQVSTTPRSAPQLSLPSVHDVSGCPPPGEQFHLTYPCMANHPITAEVRISATHLEPGASLEVRSLLYGDLPYTLLEVAESSFHILMEIPPHPNSDPEHAILEFVAINPDGSRSDPVQWDMSA